MRVMKYRRAPLFRAQVGALKTVARRTEPANPAKLAARDEVSASHYKIEVPTALSSVRPDNDEGITNFEEVIFESVILETKIFHVLFFECVAVHLTQMFVLIAFLVLGDERKSTFWERL